jgi:hypothetical protein
VPHAPLVAARPPNKFQHLRATVARELNKLDEITVDWAIHGIQRRMQLQGPRAVSPTAASGILVSQGLKI